MDFFQNVIVFLFGVIIGMILSMILACLMVSGEESRKEEQGGKFTNE